MDIILASKSPRRAWLLTCANVPFHVVVAGVDERRAPNERAAEYCQRLAREKRDAVVRISQGAAVLAADTVVVLDEDVLEKPADTADAVSMLTRLSGREHQVLTAVAVAAGGRAHHTLVTARVRFRPLTHLEIQRYVLTGEPMDKAGSYGIQGEGGALVESMEGSYTAVVGLPLKETLDLLRAVGALP